MTDSIKVITLSRELKREIENDEFVSSWDDVLLLSSPVQGNFFYYSI